MRINSKIKVRIILFIISILIFQEVQTQSLAGIIRDKDTKELIPYATVILKNQNGDFLEGTTTNEEGRYLMEYKAGKYIIEISFIGYKKYTSTIEIEGKTILNITLKTDVTSLDEVVIIAERTTVQQLIDKKVINVGKDLLSSGGDATNVLSQLTEIQVDEDGNISLKGSQNVNILINGKPSPLGVTELLQQIPADEINKIEIITSPSAKYQANGLTGIINIITKSKVQKGLNINTSVNVNSIGAYSGRTAISYGESKLSYQFGTSYSKNRSQSDRVIDRFGTSTFTQISKYKFDGDIYRINGGINWFLNENNEFSLGLNYTINKHESNNIGNILQDNINTFQNFLGNHSHMTTTVNGNYRHYFKNKEDFLEIDVQLTDNINNLESDFRPNLAVLDNASDNVVFTSNIAIDYSGTLSEKGKIEVGLLWNHENLNNHLIFLGENNLQSGENRFENTQSNYAVYGLIKNDFNKLKTQVGLRGELFKRNANLFTDNSKVKNHFINLFPSLHLSYDVSDSQLMTFGFNRRTSRPSLRQLNPITTQSSEFSIRVGNPDLDPEFSNNFDISYQFKKKDFRTSIDFTYRLKESVIVQNKFLNTNGINVTTYSNNGTTDVYSIGLFTDISPSKWLNSNIGFNWNYEEFRNDQIGFVRNFKKSYSLSFRNQVTFSKKTNAVLSWNYRGNSDSFFYTRNPIQNIDIGIRYKIFIDKGNINLRVSDVFNTSRRQGSNSGIGFIEEYNYKYISRILHFSFLYRFDGGEIKKRNKKSRDYSI
jgi:outer membrane receptor protein involved in Fe transport